MTETITYEETIPYESILYIYQIALISPTMIGIKYIDEETGERKKFYTLASWSSQLATFNFYGLKDVELVEFVRRKIKSVNPGYDESNEPTKWAPVGYMMLAIVVSIILGNLILAI
ncbi:MULTISPECIES: hypothetical protein [unclassified Imperialibacter]|uniref:hypothetical protein n=1 Tax=unclassified Imperialibacter TaxID=2629706 RepID=UPI00125F5F59|nr:MULTISPECIES: hypothetical protein [unclassified Imperialibacter]